MEQGCPKCCTCSESDRYWVLFFHSHCQDSRAQESKVNMVETLLSISPKNPLSFVSCFYNCWHRSLSFREKKASTKRRNDSIELEVNLSSSHLGELHTYESTGKHGVPVFDGMIDLDSQGKLKNFCKMNLRKSMSRFLRTLLSIALLCLKSVETLI
jgi:hypothetical protein